MKAENKENSNSRYILSSVDSSLDIMNLFFEHEELSTTEIAKLIGTSRSTAFRFMVTLEAKGFVTKTESGKYRLGLNLFSLGMLAYNRMEMISAVHPYLAELAEETTETSHLAVLADQVHVMFIDHVLGASNLRMDTPIGYREIAHCTATGKAILAFESDQQINQYIRHTVFPNNTETSIRDARELLEILEKVKEDCIAYDNEEAEIGLTCMAMPLLDSMNRPYAAISVSGPTTRMNRRKDEYLDNLRAVVQKIGKTLG
ncbi:MAG: IclR family transcriptional regulator [Anaerovoracaceae bacterium]|nr:IclR family transcriptional regulator [Anaerovoracaceae bacterium]